MRFGICCGAEHAASYLEAGFDYVEVAASTLPEKAYLLEGLQVEATNLFFPGDFRLFPPRQGDPLDHAKRVIEAAGRLGVKVMVIGSGNQRRFPAGYESPLEEFVELVSRIQEEANGAGIQVAPENLNREETNLGNDLPELSQRLSDRGLEFTIDSYHSLKEAWVRSAENLIDWSKELLIQPAHVHIADSQRRLPELDDQVIQGFITRLNDLGYHSRISFEGSLNEIPATDAFSRLRSIWTQ